MCTKEKLSITKGMFYVPHILRNIVQHKAKRTERMLEKSVSKHDIFRLVSSESRKIFIARMTTFGGKFPNARAYIEAIPPFQWVHYAQIGAKAPTFGWRSNNIGEIGQRNVLQGFRKCHPLFGFFLAVAAQNKLHHYEGGFRTRHLECTGSPQPDAPFSTPRSKVI
jgi:hypothetical protein